MYHAADKHDIPANNFKLKKKLTRPDRDFETPTFHTRRNRNSMPIIIFTSL